MLILRISRIAPLLAKALDTNIEEASPPGQISRAVLEGGGASARLKLDKGDLAQLFAPCDR